MIVAKSTTAVVDIVIQEIYQNTPLMELKRTFAQACKYSKDNNDGMPETLKDRAQNAFRQVISYVNHLIYHSNRFSERECAEIGNWIHYELIPYALQGSWPSRSFRKPQGIAGDHYTIEQIYEHGDNERRSLGHLVNHCFLREPACRAVKNRKNYMVRQILGRIEAVDDVVSVASVACGPAREIFEIYDIFDKTERKRLKTVAIDADSRAISSVNDATSERALRDYIKAFGANIHIIDTIPERYRKNDLVYSMGLIDYFSDAAAIKAINNMYQLLKPGGEVIVGNFHTSCSSRVFLDYVLDWKLNYRSEEDMRKIFERSKFGTGDVIIDYEEEKVNMLVRCTKV